MPDTFLLRGVVTPAVPAATEICRCMNTGTSTTLWHLDGLLHLLTGGRLPPHQHRYVHDLIDELRLRRFNGALHCPSRRDLSLRHQWCIRNLVSGVDLGKLDGLLHCWVGANLPLHDDMDIRHLLDHLASTVFRTSWMVGTCLCTKHWHVHNSLTNAILHALLWNDPRVTPRSVARTLGIVRTPPASQPAALAVLSTLCVTVRDMGTSQDTPARASPHSHCDLSGRKINLTNSKTLVGWFVGCRDRPQRALPLTCPNVNNFGKN